ncbi:hypothetical protein [Massilia sp. IC2-476]|uniref:hypothetical protein n=1 Tax=Massilia sp. IC2-476 TaxID=2887199 RepID=UPI001D122F51|nr:hypothetical protein [Massilia sp. IC2-476]MCC2974956.1 hypothetical protein [Massilia sp. IC2-476]
MPKKLPGQARRVVIDSDHHDATRRMPAAPSLHTAAFHLRRTSWTALAGYAVLAFFVLGLAKRAAPDALAPALHKLALVLPLLLLAAKDLSHWPDALGRLRAAQGWGSRVTALLPPELVGMVRLDRLMRTGFLQWLRRSPPAARPEGLALTYLQRGAYGSAIGIAMVSLFLEMPIDILLVNLMIDDPDTRLVVHVVAAVGVLTSFIWVLGDRWHVADGAHVLADDVLHLRVGVRTQGSIPLAAIERIEGVKEAPERWRRRHGIHSADTLLVTPFDKPNCALVLKPDADVTLLHWQVRRRAPRYVLLYVDRPELLSRRVAG